MKEIRTSRQKPKVWKKELLTDILFGILATVTAVCIAISAAVLFKPLYYYDIERLNIPENSGFTREECIRNYDALIDYNVLGGEKELQFPDMKMSQQGKVHFEEVKSIFIFAQIIAAAGGIFFTGMIFLRRRNYRWMRVSVLTAAAISAATLAAVAINWQWAFVIMHKIFFRNDYWLFNPTTDPIIKILPDTFFMHCGMMIVGMVVLINIVFEVLYRKKRKKMEQLTFKTLFFRYYDRKIADGTITFSKMGMSKNDFTKLCTEADFIPDVQTIERVCLSMQLTDEEREALLAAIPD